MNTTYIRIGARSFKVEGNTSLQVFQGLANVLNRATYEATVTITGPHGYKFSMPDVKFAKETIAYEIELEKATELAKASEAAYYARRELIGREMEALDAPEFNEELFMEGGSGYTTAQIIPF